MPEGLSNIPKSDWPSFTQAKAEKKPIEILKPQSKEHEYVKKYLCDRIEMSERASQHHRAVHLRYATDRSHVHGTHHCRAAAHVSARHAERYCGEAGP